MHSSLLPLAIILSTLCLHQGAAAQTADSTLLQSGRRSIAFSLPDGGGGEFGIWKMKSDRVNRGLFVQLSAAAAHDESNFGEGDHQIISLALGAARRRYLGMSSRVAPLIQSELRVGGSYHHTENQTGLGDGHSNQAWNLFAQARAGVGAEWFVHRSASIAGHTGLAVGANYNRPDDDASRWSVTLNTFTSALGLHIYF